MNRLLLYGSFRRKHIFNSLNMSFLFGRPGPGASCQPCQFFFQNAFPLPFTGLLHTLSLHFQRHIICITAGITVDAPIFHFHNPIHNPIQKIPAYLEQTPVLEDADSILKSALKGLDSQDGVLEGEARSMLHRLGFEDVDQPVKYLSGGQKKRVALVNVLLKPVEILILDEPTNHLDSEMSGWLEEYLVKFRGALVMVQSL